MTRLVIALGGLAGIAAWYWTRQAARGQRRPNRVRRAFYVWDSTGRRVRLEDALAELGLISDGGK